MSPTTGARLARYRAKRDFGRTAEPEGSRAPGDGDDELDFVIQKHAASHLHFDLRLEMDGVMKSWAVPKGPSLDPRVRRLAMEVEDHPMEYNSFEGTIPQGEYGGGTVMLWDIGTYEPIGGGGPGELRRAYREGRLKLVFHGARLRGEFALVRTRGGSGERAQWLLIKHADEHAAPGTDVVALETTSIATGRTMEEIASEEGDVWHSDRVQAVAKTRSRGASATSGSVRSNGNGRRSTRKAAGGAGTTGGNGHGTGASAASIAPMLASASSEVPRGGDWTFEPKYDGIRALAYVSGEAVSLVTRNGNDKAAQFPDVAAALAQLGRELDRPFVLDGEIVALDGDQPARFQDLQGRMHSTSASHIAAEAAERPGAYFAFDLLLDGDEVLVHESWRERRQRLEDLLERNGDSRLRLTESTTGKGDELLAKARRLGWEGIIAKKVDAPYEAGRRSTAWRKLKAERRQELVVGGWTEPRKSRQHIGSLLLGYYDDSGDLIYAGHAGSGFTDAGLKDMQRRLAPLERSTSPFTTRPKTNERAHWVEPRVVVEIKFNEWTGEGKLRQPVFLGVREDLDPRAVRREPSLVPEPESPHRVSGSARGAAARPSSTRARRSPKARGGVDIVHQLREIEDGTGSGTLDFGAAGRLEVTSLDKIFFPRTGTTKGDLMRYYASVAKYILPAIADRPLVLKRFPNGVEGQSFYQQRAGDSYPDILRIEPVPFSDGDVDPRFIGGDLPTLLYLVQLGAISVDPLHTRVQALDCADYAYVDLDPGPRATFARVVEVALAVKAVLDRMGIEAVPKTSGSSGMHVVIPLETGTPAEAARLLAEFVATQVAERNPGIATVTRSVKARAEDAVYVDFLQNIRGKTIASVYSVRARPEPTVSTPLHWDELVPALDPRHFTIATVAPRLEEVGDLWGEAMRRPNSLETLLADV